MCLMSIIKALVLFLDFLKLTSYINTVTVHPSAPIAIEYDYINDRVIWSDGLKQIIRSIYRNGTGAWEIFIGAGNQSTY